MLQKQWNICAIAVKRVCLKTGAYSDKFSVNTIWNSFKCSEGSVFGKSPWEGSEKPLQLNQWRQ